MNEHSFNNDDNAVKIKISDPGKALRPLHKQTKLTRKRKLEFLQKLGQEFNISKTCADLNIPRQSIMYLLNHDELFKSAFNDVKEAWLDQAEGSGLLVAIQPTREGFNDRKLFLTAHRSEYQPAQEIKVTHVVDAGNAIAQLDNLLSKFSRKDREINAIKADYKVEDT